MKQLDAVGALIVNMHRFLGHYKAASFLGQPAGDVAECILCRYDANMATQAEVLDRLGVEVP